MRKYAFPLITVGVLLFILSAQAYANMVQLQPIDGMDVWYSNVYHRSGVRDEKLQVGGWGDQYQTLLRFNLGGMPQVADRVDLWLWSFPKSGATPTWIQWFMNTSQWQTSTVGWDTRPYKFSLGYTQPPSTSGGWYGVNFTNLYNVWRTGKASPLNYGLMLAPWQNNNNFDMFFSSRNATYWARPMLYVYYTPQADDSVIKLTWPLATPKPATPSTAFGADWGPGITKCIGLPMTHTGVDILNTVGNPVFAMEDGFVQEVLPGASTGGFASAIVIEHISPTGAKYTTVSWHVNPLSEVVVDAFIPKGRQIATIAAINGTSHLHIGVRKGAYNSTYSDKGALPTGYCSELTSFKEIFLDPWNPNEVLFQ